MKAKEVNNKVVNILGTEWTIIVKEKLEEEYFLADGYCDFKNKQIVVREIALEENRILRHELIHAFLFSSGLGYNFEHKEIGHEETIVDWFSIMYPKITKIYIELDILD